MVTIASGIAVMPFMFGNLKGINTKCTRKNEERLKVEVLGLRVGSALVLPIFFDK
jgi:hypothetical protein